MTAISGNTISIGAGTGVAHTFAANVGIVLLIQMIGNTAQNGGKFEFAIVTSVSGSGITVDAINRAYTPATEKVQLVWVPYDDTSIMSSGIIAMDWNGTTGGIVSLMTPGTLILGGTIFATGAGFRHADGTNTIYGSRCILWWWWWGIFMQVVVVVVVLVVVRCVRVLLTPKLEELFWWLSSTVLWVAHGNLMVAVGLDRVQLKAEQVG